MYHEPIFNITPQNRNCLVQNCNTMDYRYVLTQCLMEKIWSYIAELQVFINRILSPFYSHCNIIQNWKENTDVAKRKTTEIVIATMILLFIEEKQPRIYLIIIIGANPTQIQSHHLSYLFFEKKSKNCNILNCKIFQSLTC